MCQNLCEELVCLLERLHLKHLQSFSNKIKIPNDWGIFNCVFTNNMMNSLKKTIMTFPGRTAVQLNLKEETRFREALFQQKEPILPGTLFLTPTEEIISRPKGKPLFPEFTDVDKEIQPDSLPFPINVLLHDIEDYVNPKVKTTTSPPSESGIDNLGRIDNPDNPDKGTQGLEDSTSGAGKETTSP